MAVTDSVIETVPTQLLIGGDWVDATGGATFEVHNPADAGVLTRVADARPEDGQRALAAAAEAQCCAALSSCSPSGPTTSPG